MSHKGRVVVALFGAFLVGLGLSIMLDEVAFIPICVGVTMLFASLGKQG